MSVWKTKLRSIVITGCAGFALLFGSQLMPAAAFGQQSEIEELRRQFEEDMRELEREIQEEAPTVTEQRMERVRERAEQARLREARQVEELQRRVSGAEQQARELQRRVVEAMNRAGGQQEPEKDGIEIEINGTRYSFQGDDLEKLLGQLADEHGQDLEKWSEKYAGRWEAWAQQMERKMEHFGEKQEGLWEDWGRKFERKMELLEFDGGDPDQLNHLIQENLEMLKEMPLGELVDGLLKEGAGELRDAPWESLGDLEHLIKDALEHSMDGMEQLARESEIDDWTGEKSELQLESMRQTLAELKIVMEAQKDQLSRQSDEKFERLQMILQEKELTDAEKAAIEKTLGLLEDYRDKQESQGSVLRDQYRRASDQYRQAMEAVKRSMKMEQQLRRQQRLAREAQLEESEELRAFNLPLVEPQNSADRDLPRGMRPDTDEASEEFLRLAREQMERKRQFERNAERARSDREALQDDRLRRVAEARERIESQDSEVESLRRMVEELKRELRELKKEKSDDGGHTLAGLSVI